MSSEPIKKQLRKQLDEMFMAHKGTPSELFDKLIEWKLSDVK